MVIGPSTPEMNQVAAWAADHAAALGAWVAEKGSLAQAVVAVRFDPQAPAGPAPYIGIPSGRGALVLFFDAQVIVQAARQVPSYVLWRILGELVALIPDSPTTSIRRAPRPARGR